MSIPNISPDTRNASADRIDRARKLFLEIWSREVLNLSAKDAETEVVSLTSAMRQISDLARG